MTRTITSSQQLFDHAQSILVGGVNSPVRSFKSVGGSPIFMASGNGPYMVDEDGNSYIDYQLSFGPLLLGHSPEVITTALEAAAKKGTSFGCPTVAETTLALLIQEFFPSIEKIRFVNSGTEAVMSAIRLARGTTQRPYIVKFKGCYHGHVDSLLVATGSGGLTHGIPDSAGVLEDVANKTLVIDYNDTATVHDVFNRYSDQIAAVILEPVCGNMGVILPDPSFIRALQECTQNDGALLIFDEVMTGFRVSLGGAQEWLGIQPDLTILGKVIGGGLPCGAYGGKASIMDNLAPLGPVYQAGTLSGNPMVMAAGIAMLTALKDPTVFKHASSITQQLATGLSDVFNQFNIPAVVPHIGTMMSVFFAESDVKNVQDVTNSNLDLFNKFFHHMLSSGIFLPPSGYEAWFISAAHQSQHVDQTLAATTQFLEHHS